MSKEALLRIAKNSHHHPWASRDYEEITCHATGCTFNRAGQCSVPSACKISDDGHCEGFTPKPTHKPDGD